MQARVPPLSLMSEGMYFGVTGDHYIGDEAGD